MVASHTETVTYVIEIPEYPINQSDDRVGISNTAVYKELIISSKTLLQGWSSDSHLERALFYCIIAFAQVLFF